MKRGTVTIEFLIILAASVAIIAFIIIPWATGQWIRWVNGECWYNTYSHVKNLREDVNNLRVGESSFFAMNLGDCTGGVIIADRDLLPEDFRPVFDDRCNEYESYKSYILALPWKTVKAELEKDTTTWEKIKDFVDWSDWGDYWRDWYKETKQSIRMLKPLCEELEIDFQGEGIVLYIPENIEEKPNTEVINTCLKIKKHQVDEGSYFSATVVSNDLCDINRKEEE
jgi:hypothetical protein